MKKVLIGILILSMSSGLMAQGTKIMAGLSFSKLHGEEFSESAERLTGLLGGLGFAMGLEKVTLEMEFFYFQKGYSLNLGPDEKVDFLLTEISMPLLLRIKFLPRSSPYVFGGGEAAYVLSYKSRIQGQEVEDLNDLVKSFDYGLVFGAGFEVAMDMLSFFLEGRYHYGLANIGEGLNEGEAINTRAVVLMAGFRF